MVYLLLALLWGVSKRMGNPLPHHTLAPDAGTGETTKRKSASKVFSLVSARSVVK